MEEAYLQLETTRSINTDLLYILSYVLELESDTFYHLDSNHLFCQIAPPFILFIDKHTQINNSKL